MASHMSKNAAAASKEKEIAKLNEPPSKRMGHCAQFIGCCLIIYGGLYGEDNKMLDDFGCYDIMLGCWIRIS